MKDIRSTRLLLKAIKDLEGSLQKPCQPHPDDAKDDFLSAVTNVMFFARVVFKDLITLKGDEVEASGALSAAIALGEFDYAIRFLKADIALIEQEGGRIDTLRELIELGIKNHGRSDRWNRLLSEFEELKKR